LDGYREMQVHLIRYFFAERRGALLLLILGSLAMVVALLLLTLGGPGLARGLAVPLGGIALLELGVGWTVFARTEAQMTGLSHQLESDPAGFREGELARLRKVLAGFRIYRLIEVAVVAGGLAAAVVFRDRPALFAAGAGCLLQGLLLLVIDGTAEERAREYVAALRRLLDDRPGPELDRGAGRPV
jgi:hypothetical protein